MGGFLLFFRSLALRKSGGLYAAFPPLRLTGCVRSALGIAATCCFRAHFPFAYGKTALCITRVAIAHLRNELGILRKKGFQPFSLRLRKMQFCERNARSAFGSVSGSWLFPERSQQVLACVPALALCRIVFRQVRALGCPKRAGFASLGSWLFFCGCFARFLPMIKT